MQTEKTNLRLHIISVNDWHHRFIYISATGLSGRWCVWNPLKFFPLTCFQFYSSHSKHAMPFQQQHSFYRWGKFMSTCSRHRPALCHRQLTHERAHLFLLKSNDSCFCNVSACAWGFIPASGLNFPRSRCMIAPCKLFELHLTLAKPAVVILSSLQTALRTLKTSKSALMVFSSFFMLRSKAVQPSSEWKICEGDCENSI